MHGNIIGDALDQCRAEVRENFIMPVVRLDKEHSDQCNLHGGHYWKNNQFCISLDAFHDIKHKCVWSDSKPITQLSCQKSKCLKVSQDQIYSSWRVHNVATVWGKVLRVMPAHFDELVYEKCNSIANALELHLSCTNPQLLCSTVLSIQWHPRADITYFRRVYIVTNVCFDDAMYLKYVCLYWQKKRLLFDNDDLVVACRYGMEETAFRAYRQSLNLHIRRAI